MTSYVTKIEFCVPRLQLVRATKDLGPFWCAENLSRTLMPLPDFGALGACMGQTFSDLPRLALFANVLAIGLPLLLFPHLLEQETFHVFFIR